MSFTTSIAGNSPPNQFIYTTTSISVDTISVENLSATNASITNLTTIIFNPLNVNTSVVDATELNASTTNSSTVNCSLLEAADIVASEGIINVLSAGYLSAATGNISIFNSSIINGDISSNLSAGTNITLTTLNGVTTINSSGGGVTDPLNISVGNISTLNTSSSTNDGTLTTANFVAGNADIFDANISYLNVSTLNVDNINVLLGSSQYAWNATSTLNNNQSLYVNNTLQFDSPDFSYPPSAYVGNGYVVPANAGGLYTIGFKCFMNVVPTNKCRLAIYKNTVMMYMGGDDVAGTEGFDTIMALVPGDVITIRLQGGTTPVVVYMGPSHSWFYGHLLEPVNQAINTTTDLTVESLTATDLNASTINTSLINVSAFGSTDNLVGKSSMYSRVTTSQFYSPPGTTTEYVNFQAAVYANTDLFTYVTPVDGGANEGFICQKAGYYKIDYSVQCFSINYQNRIQWLMIPILNNVNVDGKSQGYTRAGVLGSGFVWACNCTASMVLLFAVNDYFGLKIKCAKNDTTANDNFDSTGIDIGSTCNFQYLGP